MIGGKERGFTDFSEAVFTPDGCQDKNVTAVNQDQKKLKADLIVVFNTQKMWTGKSRRDPLRPDKLSINRNLMPD